MLNREGIMVNGKKVLRIMRKLGLKAIYPGPNTSKRNLAEQVKPYLLRDLKITRPNQVWQIDITYLRTEKGFVYLTAFIDVYTRLVVDWSVSNDLSSYSCTSLLDRAILTEKPEIINSDQGSQFTSSEWLKLLEKEEISVSMTGKGRSNDNSYIERFWRSLKYEGIYLHNLRSVKDLKKYLPKLIDWYNNERPHQSLNYMTPREFADGYVDKLSGNFPTYPQQPQKLNLNESLNLEAV